MTLVTITLTVPDGQVGDPESPAVGYQQWMPVGPGARRRAESPAREVLPAPFRVDLLPGVTTVEVAPTSASWVWLVREYVEGAGSDSRAIAVPDQPTIDYRDCPRVDPRSLTVVGPAPDPIWQHQLEALTAEIGAAQARSEAAALSASAAAGSAAGAATSATSAGQSETVALAAQQAAETARDQTNSLNLTATATTLAPGSAATAAVSGTLPGLALDLGIPRGDVGPANSLTVGTVTTLAAGASATASVTGTAPAQTLTLGIPQGVAGQPTAFELRGTGMPNGVVSAPPGTYYTDTAGTAGAWRWLKKTGAGNTGWTVIHGDTGWRLISSLITESNTTGTLSIIRTAGYVTMRASALKATTGTVAFGTPLMTLPTGFLPTYSANIFGSRGGSPAYAEVASGILYAALTTNNLLMPAWTWRTAEEWPTTLPGTPA